MIGAFFVWIILAILVGVWAGSWGRSGFGYFVLSLLISPIGGALVLLVLGQPSESARAASDEGVVSDGSVVWLGYVEKKCPDCAEQVKLEATVCKHCGHEWTGKEVNTEILSRIQQKNDPVYYCNRENALVATKGTLCRACRDVLDTDGHFEAEEYFAVD